MRAPEQAPDYSIVIPAYNEEALLPGTLESVRAAMRAQPDARGEVIVADNCSTDRTAAVAAQGGARVVHEPHRQIARARNAGAAAARGRWLIFLDADTRISARLLRQTLSTLRSGRVCGGGTRIVFDGGPGWHGAGGAGLWGIVSRLCRWAAGSYLFCRADAFRAVGGFDERFYASEEIRISRALVRWGRAHGMQFVVLHEPAVTSARKVEWHTPGQLLQTAVGLALDPSRMRRRESCGLWYDRPDEPPAPR